MILAPNKKLFLLLFLFFEVFLALLFNTSFEVIIIALFILFLTWSISTFNLKLEVRPTHFLVVLLFVSFLITSIHSHSIPLTLQEVCYIAAGLLIFLFFQAFFSLEKSFIELFAQSLLLGSFVLSLYFIFFTVFPQLESLFPSFNLFTVEIGHSHFAPLLFIAIPLAWWFHYSPFSILFKLRGKILLLFFYVLLLATLSRWAILISVLSFPFLAKIHKKKFLQPSFILFLFIAIAGLGFITFSSAEKCYTVAIARAICKPLTKEVRPYYYNQAISALIEHPLTGYGPGTFGLISKKYSIVPNHVTRYAHNFFLQIFSEYGLPSSILFLLLFTTFLLKATKSVFSGRKELRYYAALAFWGLFLNSLVDFDLNLFFYLQLFFILAALLCSGETFRKTKNQYMLLFWRSMAFLIVVVGICASIAIFSFKVGGSLRLNPLIPFFPFSYKDMVESHRTDERALQRLKSLYWNDSDFLYELLVVYKGSTEESLELYSQQEKLSRYTYFNFEYYDLLLAKGDYATLGNKIDETIAFLKVQENAGFKSGYDRTKKLQSYLKPVAAHYLQQGNVEMASKYYSKLLDLDIWFFHLTFPDFLYAEGVTVENVGHLFNNLKLRPSTFGKQETFVRDWLVKRVLDDLESTPAKHLEPYFTFYSDFEFWHLLSVEVYPLISTSTKGLEYSDWWYDFWLVTMANVSDRNKINREYQYKLMNSLFSHSQEEKAKVVQKYLYQDIFSTPK